MDVLDLTPDGRYLVYLDWQAVPTYTNSLSAIVRAADLQSPGTVHEIAYCGVHAGLEEWGGCRGFRLSPAGDRIAFRDGQGLWVAQVPEGQPRLIHAYVDVPESSDAFPDHVWLVDQWSPDGRWLLGEELRYEVTDLVLVDADSGQLRHLDARTFIDNYAVAAWGPAGVWIGHGEKKGTGGLYLAQPGEGDAVLVTRRVAATAYGILWPRSLYPLSDGRLALANRGCAANPGPESGLFLLETDGDLDYIAPLPPPSCCDLYLGRCFGQVLWSAEAQAFLYIDEAGAALLGHSDGSALWEVRALLKGATLFRWGTPAQDGR